LVDSGAWQNPGLKGRTDVKRIQGANAVSLLVLAGQAAGLAST
jgi:hypothetical protein